MGDKEKKKETSDKSNNNKDDQQHQDNNNNNKKELQRKRSVNRKTSCYSGSYVSWSSYDSESSAHSGMTKDEHYRHPKRRREPRRPRKERARHGRVAKPRRRTQKHTGRQRRKQTRKFARAMYNAPEKAFSISTIMTKVSTKSSVTVYSNELCHQPEKQSRSTQLRKEERKICVKEILKQMRTIRKPSTTKTVADDEEINQKTECIEVDEDEVSNRMTF